MRELARIIETEIKDCNLKISYHRDFDIVIARWQFCEGNERIYKGYLEILKFAKEVQCHHWIMDLRGRGPRSEKENYWVLNVFFVNVKNSFSRCVYLAYLLTPSYYNVVVPRIPLQEVHAYKDIIQPKMFNEENLALNWLLENKN